MQRIVSLIALLIFGVSGLVARTFTVMAYNVENLFDVDGKAVYEDYQASSYGPAHLKTKLGNIATVLSRFNKGQGPDIVIFNEIEFDQTPDSKVRNYDDFLKKYSDTTYDQMLSQSPLPNELAGLPAEAWLLKALEDKGVKGYHVIIGDQGKGPEPMAVKCVIFSKFPASRTEVYPIPRARDILEAHIDVDGSDFIIFANHWKSGAGDPETEKVRVEDAKVLRARLNTILSSDPNADILIAGDFNSQHNQKQRYPEMKITGINDVLGSQGNELAIRGKQRDLYNLWFELAPADRGSDTYKGEWGTLIQMIISRGLYDYKGIQYMDNSFGVARIPGLNVDGAGMPIRWQRGTTNGGGFSDHLPIYAHFQTVEDNNPTKWLPLNRPSQTDTDMTSVNKADYSSADVFATAIKLSDLPKIHDLRDGSLSGKVFRVEGKAVDGTYPTVHFDGQDYEIFGRTKPIRSLIYAQRDQGRYRFYGTLGTYKGKWQFVVEDESWVK